MYFSREVAEQDGIWLKRKTEQSWTGKSQRKRDCQREGERDNWATTREGERESLGAAKEKKIEATRRGGESCYITSHQVAAAAAETTSNGFFRKGS